MKIALITITVETVPNNCRHVGYPDRDCFNLISRTVMVRLLGIPIYRRHESFEDKPYQVVV